LTLAEAEAPPSGYEDAKRFKEKEEKLKA